jgi:hypothetical protein
MQVQALTGRRGGPSCLEPCFERFQQPGSLLRVSDLQVRRYRDAGLTDITYQVYPDARHEILNELNRDEVENDLIDWITRTES